MGVDHLGVGQLRQETERAARASRRVAKATLQNASIGHAGIRVYDGGWIRIEDGGLQVTGTASVTGTLTGSGTFDWTGPMNLQGAQTITGPTTFTGQMTVNGPWKFVGNGQITGDVDVTGNIKVLPGGKIQVGGMTIDPFTGGGRIDFGDGRMIHAASGHLAIYDDTRFIVFNSSGVAISGGGIPAVIGNNSVSMSLPTISRASANNATVGTVYMNTAGEMFRVVN
jgi:hypothetical protein